MVDTILRPDVHPETDTSDLQHLRPQERVNLFYTTNDPNNSVAASLDMKLNFSTVALEHSDAIDSAQCNSSSNMRITLNTREAYDYIAQTWPSNGSEFILASHFPGCAGHSDGTRGFSVVKSFRMLEDPLEVHAPVVNMDLRSVMQEFYFQWGMPVPPGKNSSTERAERLSSLGSQLVQIRAAPNASLLTQTNFGATFPLYSRIGIVTSCVSCRALGLVTITGAIGWSVHSSNSLFAGTLSVAGDLTMVVGVGVNATSANTKPGGSMRLDDLIIAPSFAKVLYAQPLTGLSIPSLITIGPEIAASAGMSLLVNNPGSVLASGSLMWPNFSLAVDLVSENATSSGFEPIFQPAIKGNGYFGVTMTPGLPTSLGIGINIFNGVYQEAVVVTQSASVGLLANTLGSVGLATGGVGSLEERSMDGWDAASETISMRLVDRDRREMEASSSTSSSASSSRTSSSSISSTKTSASAQASCSPGISLALNVVNNVILNVFSNKRTPLDQYRTPQLHQCIVT